MDFNGNGKDAYEVEEYEDYIYEFNEQYYNDNDVATYEYDINYLDMTNDYMAKWFADYVYIKNLSDKSVTITAANGKKLSLNPDITAVFLFWRICCGKQRRF